MAIDLWRWEKILSFDCIRHPVLKVSQDGISISTILFYEQRNEGKVCGPTRHYLTSFWIVRPEIEVNAS